MTKSVIFLTLLAFFLTTGCATAPQRVARADCVVQKAGKKVVSADCDGRVRHMMRMDPGTGD